MSKALKRDLGHMEANADPKFKQHFIEVQDLKSILDDDSDIVFGLKGSGKSALCRALNELKSDEFLVSKIINLDNLSFTQIHTALVNLKSTTHKELTRLSSHTWRNVLLLYSLEAYASILPNDHPFNVKTIELIQTNRYSNPKSNSRILSFIQNLIKRISDLGFETKEDSPIGLTHSQYEELDKKFDSQLLDLFEEFKRITEGVDKKILICLDGFDSIIDHSEESRKAIFSGLEDAIYKNAKDSSISKSFAYKAFLPRELTDGVRNSHFDSDKFIFNRHYLGWSSDEFKQLLVKRLKPYSKTKTENFDVIWDEHMPKKIKNSVHIIEEDSFEYILRHTLYRPRHLLIHLQYIFNEWDKNHTTYKVDPSYVPKIVKETNKKLAELISVELEYAIPGITLFLHSWNSISCTVSFEYFVNRMNRMFGILDLAASKVMFDKLYNIGIIGYFKNSDMKIKPIQYMPCTFAYTNGGIGKRFIFNSMEPNDIVALSPIFLEYCGCKYAEYGYVCQKILD
jgi:hypothetical protein